MTKRSLPVSEPHVLIVDDDKELCELLGLRLESNGYRVSVEHTAQPGLARLGREHIDALILDLRLEDANGLEVLAQVRERSPDVPVVMLTAHGTIETAVEAMRVGAYGFLTKPFQHHELLQKLAHAVEQFALRRELAGLRRIVGGATDDRRLVGISRAIHRVREVISRIAPTDVDVLVTGESGTGKELAARSLHALSQRTEGAFVALNCAALPPDLLESELFGHVKGAFTGAVQDRQGVFAAARGGTLFLDEIGEASPTVQVKLLRVLQERSFTKVGSHVEEQADVRIIAATNRDLRAEVEERRFREDLFYRLHVVPLEMPPLRERVEDILILAELFLERAAARHGLPVPRLGPRAVDKLLEHSWPGNVRELMHVMEAAALLAGDTELRPEHLGVVGAAGAGPSQEKAHEEGGAMERGLLSEEPLRTLKDAKSAFERAYLIEVLDRAQGNVSSAARLAGRNRSDFYDLLRRHDLSPADSRAGRDSELAS